MSTPKTQPEQSANGQGNCSMGCVKPCGMSLPGLGQYGWLDSLEVQSRVRHRVHETPLPDSRRGSEFRCWKTFCRA